MNDVRRLRSHFANRVIIFGSAILAGIIVALSAPEWIRGTVRVVAEYDAAAAIVLIGYVALVYSEDERRTAIRGAMADPGRNIILFVVLVSVAAGLAGAVVILGKGPDVHTPLERGVTVSLAIGAAVLGWLVTHATFALRYAHLYYWDDGTPCDGLTFPKTEMPDDYDFLYFSFVIGMTFQVSDVQVNDSANRRTVLVHGLISFVYNTAILALGVNLVSNLLH